MAGDEEGRLESSMTLLEKALSAGSQKSPKPADKEMKEVAMAYLTGRVTIAQCSRAIHGANANNGTAMTYRDLLQTIQAMYRNGELVVTKAEEV